MNSKAFYMSTNFKGWKYKALLGVNFFLPLITFKLGMEARGIALLI